MTEPATPRRRDQERNRRQILTAAAGLLRAGEPLTGSLVAARAGLARATVYRHFPSIEALQEAAEGLTEDAGLGPLSDSAGFDVHAALENVPPFRLTRVIAAEAKDRAGGGPTALYLVDIDGSRLLRAAGDEELPDELLIPQAVGPEVATEQLEHLHDAIERRLEGATVAPLIVRDRAIAVLIALGADVPDSLQRLAREAALALSIGEPFTDEVRRARRHRRTSAAAETQQGLLPGRVSHMVGLRFAGHVVPGYDIGSNWFDHAENEDGAWIAAADTVGVDERGAAISSVALGALKAARNSGSNPAGALRAMHDAICGIGLDDVACSAWVARWHAPTSLLFWAAAGELMPWSVRRVGGRVLLRGPAAAGLGSAGFAIPATHHVQLRSDELVLLLSDGVLGGPDAALTGPQLDQVLAGTPLEPATVVSALVAAVRDHADELQDDAMVLAFAPAPVEG